jgi:hypothetical protein
LIAPTGTITVFTDDDRRFLTSWLGFYAIAPEVLDIAETLSEQGSAQPGPRCRLLNWAQIPHSTPGHRLHWALTVAHAVWHFAGVP